MDLEESADLISVLGDDVRRRLYLFVRASGRRVTRDEAAAAAGISRKLAAFHLDKLVDRGLLAFSYGRPSGRGGRGAGRTSKLYEPSLIEIDLSIPERRYDFVGGLLVKAIREESPGETAWDSAVRVARREGMALGRAIRSSTRVRRPGAQRALAIAEGILERSGYEPHARGGEIVLKNCPFHSLAQQAPDLVCGMNRAFIDGMVRGLGNETLEVALEPEPGLCCVKLRPDGRRRRGGRVPADQDIA